jgi:membrane protein YqaA with SNARE-associated domain
MHSIISHLFAIFIRLGPFGLILLGFLDSSFLLFLPLGNDLLLVALTARNHRMLPVFAVCAATGSVLGCSLTDWAGRKGGEQGLEKFLSGRRLDYVRRKVEKSAGMALVLASLMPPPFPFTGFVAAAAALQYPRKKLLGTVGVARLVRFFILGFLAIAFGPHILRLAKTPEVHIAIIALAVISVIGSALSVVSWIKRSRSKPAAAAE